MGGRGKSYRTPSKARVRELLERRFFLRIHMTLILAGTFLAGLAATKLLMMGRVNVLALRYGLAVIAAWLMFLLLIRLWLAYVRDDSVDIHGDFIDFGFNSGSDAADAIGGGGNFGGGGASGSWPEGAAAQPFKAGNVSGGGGGDSLASRSGCGFDLDLDGLAVILLFIAVVGALLFAGVYLIWSAPAILAEAAFEAALTAALVKRARRIDNPGWVGAVWRTTFWPFLAILILAIGLGWAIQKNCPDATRLRDAFACKAVDR